MKWVKVMRRRVVTWTVAAVGGAAILGFIAWRRATAFGQQTMAIGPFPVALAVSPSTHRAFVTHQDGMVDVLDTANGTLLRTVDLGGAYGYGYNNVAVAERAHRVFVAHAGPLQTEAVSMLDVRTGRVLHTTPVGAATWAITVDERGRQVVVGTDTGISILDARTGAIRRTLELAVAGPVSTIALDVPAGRLFVGTLGVDERGLVHMSGEGGTVHTFDMRHGTILATTTLDHEPLQMVVDARRHRLFIPHKAGRAVSVLDTRSGQALQSIILEESETWPNTIAVDTAAGRLIVVANGAGVGTAASVGVFDTRTGQLMGAGAVDGTQRAIAVDERAGRAYISGTVATVAIDTRGGAIVRTVGPDGGRVAVDPAAGRLVIVRTAGTSAAALNASVVMVDTVR